MSTGCVNLDRIQDSFDKATKPRASMNLKTRPTAGTCQAARCELPSTIIDKTGRLGKRVEFCDRHWIVRSGL